MFYRAMFSRPAGLIYDCLDPKRHKVPRFTIPPTWHRMLGIDFGGINTSGIFLAVRLSGISPVQTWRRWHQNDPPARRGDPIARDCARSTNAWMTPWPKAQRSASRALLSAAMAPWW
jgi:hypothetical protein